MCREKGLCMQASTPAAPTSVRGPFVSGPIPAQPAVDSAPAPHSLVTPPVVNDAAVGAQHPMLQSAGTMRQLTGCETAADCMAKFLELAEEGGQLAALREEDCIAVMGGAIDRGNFELAKVLPFAKCLRYQLARTTSTHNLHMDPIELSHRDPLPSGDSFSVLRCMISRQRYQRCKPLQNILSPDI